MKSKREILNTFIDAVEDLEASSCKRVYYSVDQSSIMFHVAISAVRYGEWVNEKFYNIYFGGSWDGEKQLAAALDILASIKAIPDTSFDTVKLTLSVDKAKELGLIA